MQHTAAASGMQKNTVQYNAEYHNEKVITCTSTTEHFLVISDRPKTQSPEQLENSEGFIYRHRYRIRYKVQ